jgi:hypothetical protein
MDVLIHRVEYLRIGGFSVVRLALCEVNRDRVYASVRTTAGFEAYRTTDGGATWTLRSRLPLTNLTNNGFGGRHAAHNNG